MDDEQQRLMDIFNEARAKSSAEERDAYLRSACGDDDALRRQVKVLLQAHEQAGGFLEHTIHVTVPANDLAIERAGVMIGRYKLLEEIGEGGFGQVFMAEQKEPVHRKVALKIIKAGMDTKEVIARFEAERQALALMDHPNVAQVFDGGVTQAGRPYFVMELVKGVPITDYCDRGGVPMAARLQLFMLVCHAVQHAHQKGIIHRDLKPSNILITMIDGKPVPKIIDFGVAKALGQQLTEKTLFTAFEQIVGTPLYMSPEQTAISGVDVDTRSDVYSLGVLLYELLTGVTPIDAETVRKAGLDEVRRMIRETDPPKPSTRLNTLGEKLTEVAKHRHAEPAALTRQVHGDLDWIVMKALEKDRARRYDTASALAEDLQRHLKHEPVLASPPSMAYRARKYVRRHRMGMVLAASVAVALMAGLVVSLLMFTKAEEERNRTRQTLYFAHMRVAYQDWQAGQITRMLNTLRQYIPAEGQPDLRGWEWYYLLSLCHREERTLAGHAGGVETVSCHPNGRWFASGGADHSVRIWDAESGELLAELNGHSNTVASVAWSPDGAKLASGGRDGKTILWDAKTFQKLATLDCDRDVLAVAWSPDSKKVAAAGTGSFSSSNKGLVTIWDVASHQRLHYLRGDVRMIWSLAWHPAGRWLVTGEFHRGRIQVWEAQDGRLLKTIEAHDLSVFGLAWSPNGHRLASASEDHCIRIWNPETWEMVREIKPAHAGGARDLAWSPDGQTLVSGGRDGLLKLWNAQTGSLLNVLRGHQGPVCSVCWWPEHGLVLSGSLGGTMKIWDPEREQVADAPPGCRPLAWSPDGHQIAVGGLRPRWRGRDFIVAVLDAATRQLLYRLEYPSDMPQDSPMDVAWSPDSQRLAVGLWNNFWPLADDLLQVWDLAARRRVFRVARTNQAQVVRSVAWSPDGRLVLVACGDGAAYIFRPETKECVLTFREHATSLTLSAMWHPDGERIASRNAEGGVLIWDASTGRVLRQLQCPGGWSTGIAWSPRGDWLAAGCGNGLVMVWDDKTGRVIHTLRGHTSGVVSVRWSPDGRRLASTGDDRTLHIWDARSGQELLVLACSQEDKGPCVAWSPDGRRIGTADNVVRIFDATLGYEWAAKMASERRNE